MIEKYQAILNKIGEADSVLIGASNGLAISEGYNIFADDKIFKEYFGDFREKYGIRNILQGSFYKFPTEEEKWAFFARFYDFNVNRKKIFPSTRNLYELVKDKNYFVITSNTDSHFTLEGFEKARMFEFEGNSRYIQCSNRCHDKVYLGDEILNEMAKQETDGKVPTNLIPSCPECGGRMQVHVEVDQNFLRGDEWQQSYQAYQDFVKNALEEKLVLLELGVGARNQHIKAPFMNLTNLEDNVTYITINKGEVFIPEVIADKSISIDGDLAEILKELVKLK